MPSALTLGAIEASATRLRSTRNVRGDCRRGAQRAVICRQLRSISTRFVDASTCTLAMPFSCSSMIQTVSVPSDLREALVVVLLPIEDLVPLPNFGLSP